MFAFIQGSTPSRFLREERGATVVEYTVLVALIIVAIVASIALLSDNLVASWEVIAGILDG